MHGGALPRTVGPQVEVVQADFVEPARFIITAPELWRKYGDELRAGIPWPAVGLYTYFVDRIGVGLKQLLAGCRKWKLDLLSRDDLAALTERASRVTGIPTIDELAQKSMQDILDF